MPLTTVYQLAAISRPYLLHISRYSRPGRRGNPEVYVFDRKREGKEMGVLDPRLSHPNLDASLSVAIYVSTSSISQSR